MGRMTTREDGAAVTAWRERRLVAAGFGAGTARVLAADRRYDLHVLIDLVERGCPPRLAVRIVAPLDRHGRPR